MEPEAAGRRRRRNGLREAKLQADLLERGQNAVLVARFESALASESCRQLSFRRRLLSDGGGRDERLGRFNQLAVLCTRDVPGKACVGELRGLRQEQRREREARGESLESWEARVRSHSTLMASTGRLAQPHVETLEVELFREFEEGRGPPLRSSGFAATWSRGPATTQEMIRDVLFAQRFGLIRRVEPLRMEHQTGTAKPPLWKRVVAASLSATSALTSVSVPSPDRAPVSSASSFYSDPAAATLAGLEPLVFPHGMSQAQALELAAATERPGALGAAQALRAGRIYVSLSEAQMGTVDSALSLEPDSAHRDFVWKDLGAGNSPTSVLGFAQEIRSIPESSLTRELDLGAAQGDQTGLVQQWDESCAEATVELDMGDLNPEYALRVHQRDSRVNSYDVIGSGLDTNPFIAQEQKDWLESVGGQAKLRGEGGAGTPDSRITELLKNLTPDSGYAFRFHEIDPNSAFEASYALDRMVEQLRFGLETPFRVTDAQGLSGHFALLLEVHGEGDGQVFSYYDPWSGMAGTMSRKDILSHAFSVAGWDHLGGYTSASPASPDVPAVPRAS